jgi:hypothetical protein
VKPLVLIAVLLLNASTLFAGVDAFYSGVYLGMPIDDCIAYYLSGDPPIAERGHVTWDDAHAPPGQVLVDFRTGKSLHPEKRAVSSAICTANTATASFSRSPPPSNISLRMLSVDRGPVLETLVVAPASVVGFLGVARGPERFINFALPIQFDEHLLLSRSGRQIWEQLEQQWVTTTHSRSWCFYACRRYAY